jgi:hypothetical protein
MELIGQAQMALPWAEAGIVSACVGSFYLIIRRMFEFFEDLQRRHEEERNKWLESEEKRTERLEKALDRLAAALKRN